MSIRSRPKKRPSKHTTTEPVVQNDSERVRIVFKNICAFCSRYDKSRYSINAGSAEAKHISDLVNRFAIYIARAIPNFDPKRMAVRSSKPKPSMPRVPWVAMIRDSMYVSKALSVTVCFGRHGDGAVAGAMIPSMLNIPGVVPVVRSNSKTGFIDVDGNSLNTRYNDHFLNPKEFLVSTINGDELIRHLTDSIELL